MHRLLIGDRSDIELAVICKIIRLNDWRCLLYVTRGVCCFTVRSVIKLRIVRSIYSFIFFNACTSAVKIRVLTQAIFLLFFSLMC